MSLKIRTKLQFFAEPVSAGAAQPATVTPEPATSTPEPSGDVGTSSSFASLAEQMFSNMNQTGGVETPVQDTNEETPTQPEQPTQNQPAPIDPLKVLREAGLTKFNDLESFVKSYKNIEIRDSRLAQENKRIANELAAMQQKLQQQSQPVPQPETNPDPNVNPLDALYENPDKFIQERVEKLVQERLKAAQEPINQELSKLTEARREQLRNTATIQFMNDHPETANFITEIASMIADDQDFYNLATPEDVADRLDSYLTIAKGKAYQEPPSVDKVLQDALTNEELLSKYILGNETIRNRILTDAMNTAKKVPPVISKPGGNTLTPPDAKQPGSFSELGDSLKKQFGL